MRKTWKNIENKNNITIIISFMMFFEAADGSTKTVGNKSGEHNDKTVMRTSAQQ